jgi:NTE family protein
MDITLALGGGGSRGHAHVGVIRRLEQEGFCIRAVAGSSAGGITAAFYAAGYTPDEMEALFSSVDQTKLFGRSPGDGPALLGVAGASKWLHEHLGERTFADLKIPCALTAVDIKSAREIILDRGRLVDAVLATIALPGILPPRPIQNYQLVDGGVLDPLPVSVARSLAPHLPVVAVILTPLVEQTGSLARIPLPVSIPAPIVERITRLRVAQAFNIFLHSVDAGGRLLTELRLQVDNPEVVIRPAVGHIGLLDKVDVHEVIRLGEQAVDVILPELKRSLAWPNRLRRRWFNPRYRVLR